MLKSVVCRYEHFNEDWYLRWAQRLHLEPVGVTAASANRNIHRKSWEWCAIMAALEQRDMLRPGRAGLGFAVGREPVASMLAACGVDVLGTDLGADAAAWEATGQYARSAEHLYHPSLIDRASFDEKVYFHPADMNDLSGFRDQTFDFVWSSCAFEHLGSLGGGMDFVKNAMRLIKPGGIAVHTTEYNVSSNAETLDSGENVIYRKRDIEELDYALRKTGAALERVDFDAGTHPYDIDYDIPPYYQDGRKHVKLLLGGFVSTSILLIIQNGLHAAPAL